MNNQTEEQLKKAIDQKLSVKLKLDDHSPDLPEQYMVMNPQAILLHLKNGKKYVLGVVTYSVSQYTGCSPMALDKINSLEVLEETFADKTCMSTEIRADFEVTYPYQK